jgi:hypothetical protein
MKISLRRFAFIFATLLLFELFQNCSPFAPQGVQTDLHVSSYNFNSMNNPPLVPASDRIDAACMTSSQYDACIFNKNPVAQNLTATTGPLLAANLSASQNYGVKLTHLAGTGALSDGTVHLTTLNGTPVAIGGSFKFATQNDPGFNFSQVMDYYWLDRATEYIGTRTGVFQAKGQNINVIVDDQLAGWSSHTNSIHLQLSKAGNPMAWSAELAIHFLGLAALHYATNGAIEVFDPTQHTDCNLRSNGCCSKAVGCAKAIASGVGDYMAALIFPTQPRIGEAWANDPGGMKLCGLDRDLNHAASTTVQSAFAACPASNAGDATVMGSVYAAVWWQVRAAALAADSQGDIEIDTLFMNHLYDLKGSDTFETAFQRVIELDNFAFAGKHVALLQNALAAHGL